MYSKNSRILAVSQKEGFWEGTVKLVEIKEVVFSGKKNFPWESVEKSAATLVGTTVEVKETGDKIIIGSHFPGEYSGSVYTKKLHGTIEKAKGNAVQVVPELIENATNRRWIENKEIKHEKDAKKGWYRYDVHFSLPVEFAGEKSVNIYRATIVARINDSGIYLHDIINIKKEDSKPFESKDRTV